MSSLLLKHEGHNPTGSFKDRGDAYFGRDDAGGSRWRAGGGVRFHRQHIGVARRVCRTGPGIPALWFLCRAGRLRSGKLAQSLGYGARTLLVDGDFDDCLRLGARGQPRTRGCTLVNSINPWRIEGQKTIVFELLMQLGWTAPDWIALPAGALGNTSAFGKAAARGHSRWDGLTGCHGCSPVQAAGAAPFAKSVRQRLSHKENRQAENRCPRRFALAIRPAGYRAVHAIHRNEWASSHR